MAGHVCNCKGTGETSRLAGIVFTAMILEDQRIVNVDLQTCLRVVATKVQGTLGYFVMQNIFEFYKHIFDLCHVM